jgi:predicted membrane channel-forming protein YqfA (hemolysin III family)
MFFIIKILLAAFTIAFASWLAGRKPVLAGFIIALPLVSILGILFAYNEHHNMEKINQFATSIFVAVPLSLLFFVPFLLNKWLKLNFALTFTLGIVLLVAAYIIHTAVFKIGIK